MLKQLVALSILFITFTSSFAQGLFPPIQNFSSADYGKAFSPENFCAAQDERGIMYFGSLANVLQYDGETWRNIPVIETKQVRSIKEHKGKIYVGTYNDFGVLESDEHGELNYVSLCNTLSEDQEDFFDIWTILEVGDDLYFHSQQQIFKFSDNKITALEMPSTAHTAFVHNNSLVARMRGKGLMRYQNGFWKTLPGSEEFSLYGVFGIIENGANDLIISQEVGFWQLKENDSVVKLNLDNEEYLNSLLLFNAKKLSNGMIALSTYDKGVILVDVNGREIGKLDKRSGIRVNDVKNIFEDREENLWLPLGNGISLINLNASLSYFTESNGLFGNVETMVYGDDTQDKIYVGTSEGLYVSTNKNKSTYVFEKIEEQNSAVWDIKKFNNKLLIASSNGFYVIPLIEKGELLEARRLSFDVTNAILIDETENVILVAGNFGYKVLDFDLKEIHTTRAGLSTISNIVKDPKSKENEATYWMSMLGQGVLKIESFDGFYLDSFFSGSEIGLDDDNITVPFNLGGKTLLGSSSGILEVVVAEDETVGDVFEYFDITSVYDSVIQEDVYALEEAENRTWISIKNRVCYFDKNAKKFVNRPFWGINSGRINNFYVPENSRYVWIGTADGVIRFDEEKENKPAANFHAYVRKVVYGEDSVLFAGNSNETIQLTEIEFYQNKFIFEYATPYFQDNYPVEYAYILEGESDNWSNWSSKTDKEFSNLSEGSYTFKVKARNVYQQESEVGTYTFTILPPWYRTWLAYLLYFILFLALIYVIIKIASARLKRKNEELEKIVLERTEEIAEQNDALEIQKDEILHQKNEIEDSINYAERIQRAILPLDTNIADSFQDHFVLFWPKDIVSGDFYWFAQVGDEHVFVCADCTGHGVPGAFMSMIGSDKLNVCVLEKGITSPDKILSFLNQGIKSSLKQDAEEETTRDGMDASIITVNFKTNTLLYAGAYRALWRVRNGELEETKATKVAVGGFTPNEQVYTLEHFDLEPGDRFYMSTDGYADQFGGAKGKKFKVKAMKNLILEHYAKPMSEQGIILADTMKEWMDSKHEQIDDICVVGIHITDKK